MNKGTSSERRKDAHMGAELAEQRFEDVGDFLPEHTFECGQCFRWRRENDGSYSGVVSGALANLSYAPYAGEINRGAITVRSGLFADDPVRRERYWRNYLDLDRDYTAAKQMLAANDKVMARAIEAGWGIRILNQEKWETLVSFIISQNNNIPRITGCIESLCRQFGARAGRFGDREYYAFPAFSDLARLDAEDLAASRLGYRARYIVDTAAAVSLDGGAKLESGGNLPIKEIESYLLSLPGVGPKVAGCVLLFAMKKTEAFPVDVWVKRVMSRFYGMDENNLHAIKDYAARHFGNCGGLAQQYLFNYIRQ
ncbi:MAG: 8-oxoguanine DNA glycosylase [Acidobacteriota bacterium]|jgi:N-glycosylase/DNA lyase|nr:8-oxoguanine DNA glycosylase [Acidobacteriota bacterium]